jgi:hypothetical protein
MMEGYCKFISPGFYFDSAQILEILKEDNKKSIYQVELQCMFCVIIAKNKHKCIFQGLPASEEMHKLYNDIETRFNNLTSNLSQGIFYEEMFEILKEMCVLFNNIYIGLENKETIVSYHTSEINIVNVIRMLEIITGCGYIYYGEKSKGVYYSFQETAYYSSLEGTYVTDYDPQLFDFWYYSNAYLEVMLLATYEHDKELEKKYGFE